MCLVCAVVLPGTRVDQPLHALLSHLYGRKVHRKCDSLAQVAVFQVLGWGSVLALNAYQVNRYGFTAQFDTLGMQMTLAALSIYISFT